jgi:hypothetical protein
MSRRGQLVGARRHAAPAGRRAARAGAAEGAVGRAVLGVAVAVAAPADLDEGEVDRCDARAVGRADRRVVSDGRESGLAEAIH